MPISEDQWDELEPVVSMRSTIFDLFLNNPSKAYSSGEVIAEIVDMPDDETAQISVVIYYEGILDSLADAGKLSIRQLKDVNENGEQRIENYYRLDSEYRDRVRE